MTSNIGARFIQRGGRLGFQSDDAENRYKQMKDMVMEEVRKIFSPEFLNRLDEVIVFRMLSEENLNAITHLLIGDLNETIRETGMSLSLTSEAAAWLVATTCADRTFGARPLRRAIQRNVEDALAEGMIRRELPKRGHIVVHLEDNSLVLKPKKTARREKHQKVTQEK
jgi:ATP-dependent Clp protease ATP-binding subunit ClpC